MIDQIYPNTIDLHNDTSHFIKKTGTHFCPTFLDLSLCAKEAAWKIKGSNSMVMHYIIY